MLFSVKFHVAKRDVCYVDALRERKFREEEAFDVRVQEMGLPGFGPGSRAPEAHSLDQASRQPLHRGLFDRGFEISVFNSGSSAYDET